MKPDISLDYRGLICPQPVANLSREFRKASPGQIIEVMADDPAFESDVIAWSRAANCEIIDTVKDGKTTKIYLQVK